jgi:K+/H+ antiporter YhaU regulatory subunit KhtT
MRARELITNPQPQDLLRANDLLGVIGDAAQLEAAKKLLSLSEVDDKRCDM